MNKTVTPGYLHGELRVLPSKSASHRAVMMAALARGKTLLEPMQLSKDIGATLACAQALGLTRGAAMAAGETEGFVRAEIACLGAAGQAMQAKIPWLRVPFWLAGNWPLPGLLRPPA